MALEYHDHRFRTHPMFPAHVFSFLQKRDALTNTKIKMDQSTYESEMHLLSSIMHDDPRQAAEEEAEGKAFSNCAMEIL